MIIPCTMPRKYPIASSLVADHTPAADRVPILPRIRDFPYIADITIFPATGSPSGARWFEAGRHTRRRPDAADRERGAANRQVDGRAEDDRTHAAKAIEEGLRNALAQEGHAQGQAGDQDAGGAERGTQLD